MAFSRRHNSSSPVDDVPTVVVDKPIPDRPIPDVWAEYAKRRRERVQNAEQKFSEMIGTRPYDPDDKDAFDGQIDAEAADWTTEDVATHRKWCSEISERLAEAENEVTRTETKLAAAEQELREAEQKMLDAPPLQSGGRPTPAPTTDAADVAEPAATQAGAQSMGRWRDPVAMHRMHNPWWIPWLLLGAFGGDIAVFYVVLERLLRSSLVTVIIVALAFALLALGLSRVIGRSLRRRKAHDPDRNDIWLWVPLGAWILLGLAAASGRLFFGNLSAPVLVFGAPEASSARGDDLAVLPAVIFFVLYLGSGIVAMYASYEAYNPAAKTYELAVSLRDKAQREVERCAGMCSVAQARKARIEEEAVDADKRLERAELVTHNEVVGLKHFVRHRMAGNTDSPRGLALFMEDAPESVEIPAEDDL